jgi:alpha-1,2-mannosyltransferase
LFVVMTATIGSRRGVRPWPLPHVAALLVAFGLVWLTWGYIRSGIWVDSDVYTQGGRAVLDGRSPYDISVHGLPFTYSPFAAVLFAPLAAVPTQVARYLVTALSVAAYVTVGTMVGRRLGLRLEKVLPLLVVGLALEPFIRTVLLGQINTLLMLGVVLDCLVLTRGRGWLVGFATGVKLTPGVFVLYFALKRDWVAVRGAVLGFIVSVTVGTLVMPGASLTYWTGGFARLSKWGTDAVIGSDNQSLYGAMLRALGTVSAPPLASPLLLVAGVALGLWAARRALAAGEDVTALVAVATGGLLASPISWTHHWVWVLPAMLVLLHRRQWLWTLAYALLFVAAPMWFVMLPMSQIVPGHPHELTLGVGGRILSVAYVVAGLVWLAVVSRAAPVTAPVPSVEQGQHHPDVVWSPDATTPTDRTGPSVSSLTRT